MNKFGNFLDHHNLTLPDADVLYFPKFLSLAEADKFYLSFLENLQWEQHYIKIFGKHIAQPRLTALYAENTSPYSYSNLTLVPHPFTPQLHELQERIKNGFEYHFTHCLANLYRTGSDSMGWHSDDEKELGKNPVIASLSFGANRKFQLKHKEQTKLKFELELEHGSLFLMKGSTQRFWKHQLPKTKKELGQRINLTFRKIL